MEPTDHPVALVVEAPVKGVIVIRVTGDLDRTTAQGLVEVLDSQLQFRSTADTGEECRLVVDLSGVGRVEPEGLQALRHAHEVAREAGMALQTIGFADRSVE